MSARLLKMTETLYFDSIICHVCQWRNLFYFWE